MGKVMMPVPVSQFLLPISTSKAQPSGLPAISTEIFSIETGRASDTLVASFIGYHKSELPSGKTDLTR
jgi:hypothetical protein